MAQREEIDQLGLASEIGRREALGLSLYGALGVGMVGSWLLTRDSSQAGPGEAASEGTRPGHVAALVPVRGRAHRVHPAALVPKRVAVARRPVCTVHELIPDAPKRAIALTIDDGPDPRWTPLVLDLLAHYEILATFCLIGVAVRDHPALVRDIVKAGHQVANHTMHHPINFGRLPGHRVDTEIGDAYKHIHQITGVAP